MKTNKSNTELILRLSQDDKVAFYNLYERYSKRLYSFVFRFIKQELDTEEIVQEVFVKIWEKRRNIDAYSSFESYLFTVAYNSTISLFRKRLSEKKYFEHIASLQEVNKAPNLIDEIQFNDLINQVNNLLAELTPRQREIYSLSRESGLSYQDIAKKLNISASTVKKHMANTLSFLKSNLNSSLMTNILFIYLFF
ncbi:RNA polymerase sigma-70 factor [Prolixibacteraceae bacterium Z1-6]|uniref:RNA polymerase sigma factor n=1 Tax=Draconibacterium aestuarii TaxID=2998507 RepID=A0A9X3J6P5_9BACT|nr:RNA polymerase sigma-70 factor [Prolixibacteraceae bacterium Z1-6]